MARPKLGDSESKRLQMVITEDEIEAIEDWRFASRVQSKSEAIRRLVQIGLRMEREIPNLLKHHVDVSRGIESIALKLTETKLQLNRERRDAPSGDELVEIILRSLFRDVDNAMASLIDAKEHLYNLVGEITPLVHIERFVDVAEALKAANKTRDERPYSRTVSGPADNLGTNKADEKS